MTLSVGVCGLSGRVAQAIREGISRSPRLVFAGGTSRSLPIDGENVLEVNDLFSKADVVIDFSLVEGLPTHLEAAVTHQRPLVVGTTNLSEAHHHLLEKASQKIPLVYSPNMSIGVTLLTILLKKAAMCLTDWDIDLMELHHRHKKDAPSGTASLLGQALAQGAGFQWSPETSFYSPLTQEAPREPHQIGLSVQRAGNSMASHTVTFRAANEAISLSHEASSRDVFAEGALRAALWVVSQSPGLYSMQHVLGIQE